VDWHLACPSLKKLNLRFDLDDFAHFDNTRALEDCPLSLEELTLDIKLSTKYYKSDGAFTQAIEKLPGLKRLTLQMQFSDREESITIKSTTLEEIDMRGAKNIHVVECICPSLKKFHFESEWNVHRTYGRWNQVNELDITGLQRVPGILRPVTPFSSEDFVLDIERHLDMFSSPSLSVEFEVDIRPFVGMVVPSSCVVEIHLLLDIENVGEDDY